jgi:serine/threonine protein kinase
LIKKLGDGLFGVGYRAIDTNTNQTVCVKVFKETTALADKSFKCELNTGYKGFNHPNILKILGAGKNKLVKDG